MGGGLAAPTAIYPHILATEITENLDFCGNRAKNYPGCVAKPEADPGDYPTTISRSALLVKKFEYTDEIQTALEMCLSTERFATYFDAAGRDRRKALQLYTWNAAISAAFYGPLQGLEVALRNAMHRELSQTYGPSWYDNRTDCDLDQGALRDVAKAKKSLADRRRPLEPGRIVAELSFGFWVSLVGRGYKGAPPDMAKRNYEMTLWRPALRRSFPHRAIARAALHKTLDPLRRFRNRIAHHEPIFSRDLAGDHQSILHVAGWIDPHLAAWMNHHSRVLSLPEQGRSPYRF